MTYYYNNQKVRTSKTMEYHWATIRFKEDGTIECMSCSKTREGSRKRLIQCIYNATNNIERCKKTLDTQVFPDWQIKRAKRKIEEDNLKMSTLEFLNTEYKEELASTEKWLKKLNSYKTVELEKRER